MTVYLILFMAIAISGTFFLLKITRKNATSVFYWLTLCAMLFVQCLRSPMVGEDTAGYLEWFNEYVSMEKITSLYHPWRDIDLGYSILNIIISRITSNEQILIAVVSVLILVLHMTFLKKNSSNIFLSVMLFFGFNYFVTSMVSWRQFIAMGIVFWVYPLVIKEKYIKAFVVSVVAILFHDATLVFVVALLVTVLLSNKKSGNIITWLMLCLGIILTPIVKILIPMIAQHIPSLSYYFDGSIDGTAGMGTLRILYIVLEIGLMLIITRKKQCRTKEYRILLGLMMFAVLLGVYSSVIPRVFRVSYFFDYFLLLLIPKLIMERKKDRVLLSGIVVLFSAMLFLYHLSYNAGQVVPYTFFF